MHAKDMTDLEGRCFGIIALVAQHYGVTVGKMCSKRRYEPLATARQVAMFLCRKEGATESMVGHWFNRDHSTVNHAYHKIRHKVFEDEQLRSSLIDIDAQLTEGKWDT